MVPKSHGGTDRYDNLVAACRTCNQQRGNQTLEQWLKRRPKKLGSVDEWKRYNHTPAVPRSKT